MFQLIEKCYQNKKFPKSNIDVMEKLFRSLPFDFINTKHFILSLKEANQVIWPDSSLALYSLVEDIYNQLLQFETSMKVKLSYYYSFLILF